MPAAADLPVSCQACGRSAPTFLLAELCAGADGCVLAAVDVGRALERRAAAAEAAVERLANERAAYRAALERIAAAGCRDVPLVGGLAAAGADCLSRRRDAIDRPDLYVANDRYRALVAGDLLCDPCRARLALGVEPQPRRPFAVGDEAALRVDVHLESGLVARKGQHVRVMTAEMDGAVGVSWFDMAAAGTHVCAVAAHKLVRLDDEAGL